MSGTDPMFCLPDFSCLGVIHLFLSPFFYTWKKSSFKFFYRPDIVYFLCVTETFLETNFSQISRIFLIKSDRDKVRFWENPEYFQAYVICAFAEHCSS